MQEFLDSSYVVYGTDKYVPEKVFIRFFKQYCRENNKRITRYIKSIYEAPLSEKGLTIRYHTCTYKGKAFVPQDFIFGVDIMEEEYGTTYLDV
jgi:hypothetical protein